MNDKTLQQIATLMDVPAFIREDLFFFMDAEEQALILSFDAKEKTGGALIGTMLSIEEGYRRGLLSRTEDDSMRISTFSEFFEIWLILHPEQAKKLTQEKRTSLREWYFASYYESKPETWEPAADFTLPLADMLIHLENETRDIYLCDCECRILSGNCDRPVKNCFSFHTGINSFADRGVAEKISREEACEIVRRCDREGLMHTVNGMGCCQCCGDCCIMFCYTDAHNLHGTWPIARYRISADPSACSHCSTCITRCHFHVFSYGKDDAILCDSTRCVGCGLCANTCPSGALTLLPLA